MSEQTIVSLELAHCPKCRNGMVYVASIPRHSMQRTTFVCYTCRQTRSYTLPTAVAEAYAAAAPPILSQDVPAGAAGRPAL